MAAAAVKWSETALLVIDMQNDFILPGGPMHVAGGEAIVPSVAGAVSAARERGVFVIWVVREHDPLGRDVELFRRHLYSDGKGPTAKGSKGAVLADGLVIREGDYKLVKTRFSAFFDTHLHSLLQSSGIKSLVVVGWTRLSRWIVTYPPPLPSSKAASGTCDDTCSICLEAFCDSYLSTNHHGWGIIVYHHVVQKENLGCAFCDECMAVKEQEERVQTPNCIRQTVFDAVALNYQHVTIIVDATAAATPEIHLANIMDMKNIGVATPTLQQWCSSDA